MNIVDEKKHLEAVQILKEGAADLEGTYTYEVLKEEERWKSIEEKQKPVQKEIAKLLRAEKEPKEFLMRYSVDDRVRFAKVFRSHKKSGRRTFGAKSQMLPRARKARAVLHKCEYCDRLLLVRDKWTVAKRRLPSGRWSPWMCPSCQKLWNRSKNKTKYISFGRVPYPKPRYIM